ncbi:GNAT family N-acetyltransferase [Neptunicella sp. SCSIO 80796]|uniref:GNAT family N-acetyltransferase n=1 Tax=Neptunicella plasticusilytica TaxID=3117012 RepID=UPI003A4D2896
MKIVIDDLMGDDIAQFLQAHLDDMRATSPPESKHALDLEGLRQSDITFWTVWDNGELVGCGALKQLDHQHAELKSMRTSAVHRGQGVASFLLQHIIQVARERQYQKVSLETGSMDFFQPARQLYAKFGFQYCPPFADYNEDPNSVFMCMTLAER